MYHIKCKSRYRVRPRYRVSWKQDYSRVIYHYRIRRIAYIMWCLTVQSFSFLQGTYTWLLIFIGNFKIVINTFYELIVRHENLFTNTIQFTKNWMHSHAKFKETNIYNWLFLLIGNLIIYCEIIFRFRTINAL